MHVVSTNFTKTLVRKRELDITLRSQHQRISQASNHHKLLLNTRI